MTAPFIGEIRAFGFNFPPRNYMFASGQLLPIAQYTALFSILGTTYGGNGTTNFALPDLRGRVAIAQGQGPGLSQYVLGETTGTENVTLLSTEMPAHTHQMMGGTVANAPNQVSGTPEAGAMFGGSSPGKAYVATAANLTPMAVQTIGFTGGGQVHNNIQPVLCINYCVAIQGIFPTRN
ncbi:phage tail protein [Sphingomonas sp.]|jgi:microcystin-dependent protein|uniref:phage tail protein n=1 Tax=Sphingomonas sp. TaxID=28214 RepID=UPI002E36738E|nr:tail fiber protein [Sphingomonas sp.]HEX4695941.1 tail fiber protein [Sphingomonas sp.]